MPVTPVPCFEIGIGTVYSAHYFFAAKSLAGRNSLAEKRLQLGIPSPLTLCLARLER